MLADSTDRRPPLTYAQAAEYLNDKPRHLYDLVARGEIPYVKLGRLVRFLPDQLDRWLSLFPREQLLVVTTEELGARPEETYASVLAFLGAPPHALDAYPRVFDRDYPPMREETRHALTVRFAEPNRRLEDLLGHPLGWPAP